MSEAIWFDRKRIFGMAISFTRYRLYENKLVHSIGLVSISEGEILLYKILDVELKYTIIDRLFGVGTIVVHAGDVTDSTFYIRKVKNPRDVLEQLNLNIEKERTRLGVRGKELYGISNNG